MSLMAGVMIAAVAMVRALAIDRLPKRVFLYLWGAVTVCLLVPVTLPSPVSLYHVLPSVRAPAVQAPATVPAPPAVGGAAAYPGEDMLQALLPLVWAAGALALAVFFLVGWRRCRRTFRESLPVEEEFALSFLAERPLRRRVELRKTDRVSSPLTYGLFHPVILLPSHLDLEDRGRLGYILSHERYHIQRLDILWKAVLTAALCIHWFNPLVWCMYVLANRDLELSCDEGVIRLWGESSRSEYALALISMEAERSGLTPFCNHFNRHAIEERVQAILSRRRTSVAALTLAVAAVGIAAALFAPSSQSGETVRRTQNAAFAQESGFSMAIGGVSYFDPEERYTQEQYDRIAALKTEGYEQTSIAAFNRTLFAAFQEEPFDGSLIEAWEFVSTGLPADDPLSPFVYYSVAASLNEYVTKLEAVYEGREAEYAFSGYVEYRQTADVFGERVEVGAAQADVTIRYRILDQDALTVGERDKFLMDIMTGMQNYLAGVDLSGKHTQSGRDGSLDRAELEQELARVGNAAGTDNIVFSGGSAEGWAYGYGGGFALGETTVAGGTAEVGI